MSKFTPPATLDTPVTAKNGQNPLENDTEHDILVPANPNNHKNEKRLDLEKTGLRGIRSAWQSQQKGYKGHKVANPDRGDIVAKVNKLLENSHDPKKLSHLADKSQNDIVFNPEQGDRGGYTPVNPMDKLAAKIEAREDIVFNSEQGDRSGYTPVNPMDNFIGRLKASRAAANKSPGGHEK